MTVVEREKLHQYARQTKACKKTLTGLAGITIIFSKFQQEQGLKFFYLFLFYALLCQNKI